MNVSLTPELERWIQDQVDSGRYASASEVVRESLRFRQETLELHAARLETLRQELDRGLRELEKGEGIPGEGMVSQVLTEIYEGEDP